MEVPQAPQKKGVKLRHVGPNGRAKSLSFSLTVPPAIAVHIPPTARFDVELTDDGILYRIRKAPAGLPDWTQS